MATITKDLGAVTAYAYAVAGGYTGTEEEFEAMLGSASADLAEVVELHGDVVEKAAAASASADSAAGSASTATTAANTATTKAGEASASATAANTSAGQAATSASAASSSAAAALASEQAAAESARTLTIDPTLTQPGQAAEAKATGDAVGEVKNAINSKVDKDGVGQVTTKNIQGMVATGNYVLSENLFPTATLVAHDKYAGYISGSTGKVVLSNGTGYDTYIIPVDGESIYNFTFCRTAVTVTDLEYTPVGGVASNVTSVDSTGGNYILFSFKPAEYPVESYVIAKPVPAYYIPADWVVNSSAKTRTDRTSGAIASNGTMTIVGRSALKDGQMIAFKGKFESFSGFTLNFFGTVVTNYIAVTGSTIAIKSDNATPTPVNHGLTIQNEVALTVEFIEGSARISLYSMGNVYTQTVPWYQTGGTVTQPQIKSDGTAFSEANLVTSYDCAIRDIWYFGDSYIGSSSPDRWCYYLKENGYMGNILINGSAGSTTYSAVVSFDALLKYGTPKMAVMATGMNDGSDGTSAPTAWTQRRDEFLKLCTNNGITPIFCTVPTVPSVNNEQKNAWVRSSGYRYIDFASAVGADGTGTWYSGMLSGDNVHPSATGAKALYTQVLIDLPEVTIY